MVKKFYIETYGCQMNVADSEVVAAVLEKEGYKFVKDIEQADLIIVNTCSVRENAEVRVRGRLHHFKSLQKKRPEILIALIGCMAERLKDELFEQEKNIDIIVGPDSYLQFPKLIKEAEHGDNAMEVELSLTETYKDICPTRINDNSISGFVSIMRGCNNFCTYCIVPYTRGRERSREVQSVVNECKDLEARGYKEITLLGQNVNSYNFVEGDKVYTFHDLLEIVAQSVPSLRIRFSTSHPKDMSDEMLKVMAKYDNICKYIHLPVQSGSDSVLKLMNRKYTKDWYMGRIEAINKYLPDCGLSTDVFVGFHGETEDDFKETINLMKNVRFDLAYMFKYSEREGTYASKNLPDNIPEEEKGERLAKLIVIQRAISLENNKSDLGKTFEVLVEGISKKREDQVYGRTSQNKVCVFARNDFRRGDLVNVNVVDCTSATLIAEPVL